MGDPKGKVSNKKRRIASVVKKEALLFPDEDGNLYR